MKFCPLLPVLACLLLSCGSTPPEEEENPDQKNKPRTQVVGRIASVSKTGTFVLIQKFGPGLLPPDALYQSRGLDDRSASLRPSGERIRDFFAADLLSGQAQKGDAVIAYSRLPEKPETAEGETPPEEEASDFLPSPDSDREPAEEDAPGIEPEDPGETVPGRDAS